MSGVVWTWFVLLVPIFALWYLFRGFQNLRSAKRALIGKISLKAKIGFVLLWPKMPFS